MGKAASASEARALRGWTVIGLRPSAQQPALRRAVRALGADHLAAPVLRLLPPADPAAARAALRAALDCEQVLFTSPAAVAQARALLDLRGLPAAIAVGSGTARALRRAGVGRVRAPARAMRSEGVLELPELSPPPARVGLVTAPGGRGLLASALLARGAEPVIAEVYRRTSAPLRRLVRERLAALQPPVALLLTSAEALQALLAQLDPPLRRHLAQAWVVAASPRLVAAARAAGFERVIDAGSPLPGAQLAALSAHAKAEGFR